MADSVKERILQNLVTTLQAINGAPPYLTSLNNRVFRMGLEGFDAGAHPFAVVAEPDEQYLEESAVSGQQIVPCFMTVNLAIWLHGIPDGTVKLSKLLADALQDLQRAVLADRTRGGIAINTRVLSASSFVDHASEPNGLVEMVIQVHYRFMAADPTVAA